MRLARIGSCALIALAVACTGGERADPEASSSPEAPPSRAVRQRLVVGVIGDWGAGTPAQRRVAERICAVRAREPFRYLLTTGDNFYGPDGRATLENFYRPSSCLRDARGLTWRATWGDHDSRGPSTGTVLGAKRTYAWSARGVDFFALDTNTADSSVQQGWLRDELAGSNARVKIVYFHHPAFASGNNEDDPEVQARWVPLFEEHDVALVLNGDHHVYEHHRVNGVDYVITGGGGQFLHQCARQQHPELLLCEPAHHFLLLEIEGGTVTVRAIRPNGRLLDRFVIGVQ